MCFMVYLTLSNLSYSMFAVFLVVARLGMEVRKDENFSEWYSQVSVYTYL